MITPKTIKMLCAVSVIIIAIPAFSHAAAPKLYKFDDLKFSIECPYGYTAEKYENTVSVLLSSAADNRSFKPNVTLSSAPNSNPPIDLERFFGLVLQNFLKDANFSVLLAEKVKFQGRDAYKLLYKRTAALKDIHDTAISTKVLQIYMVEPSRVYVMNYSAAESDYDSFLAIADGIMRSFKIVEETTSTMIGKKNTMPDLPDVKF